MAIVGREASLQETAEPSELARAIHDTEFPGWRLAEVDAAGERLTVQVDRAELDQQTYVPTLGAVCDAIAASKNPTQVRQIAVLNSRGDQGWVYEAGEQCAELVKTPPKLMRLAIIGGSQPYGSASSGRG